MYLFDVCECFACLYVCVSHVCPVPGEVRRWYHARSPGIGGIDTYEPPYESETVPLKLRRRGGEAAMQSVSAPSPHTGHQGWLLHPLWNGFGIPKMHFTSASWSLSEHLSSHGPRSPSKAHFLQRVPVLPQSQAHIRCHTGPGHPGSTFTCYFTFVSSPAFPRPTSASCSAPDGS